MPDHRPISEAELTDLERHCDTLPCIKAAFMLGCLVRECRRLRAALRDIRDEHSPDPCALRVAALKRHAIDALEGK